LISPFPPRLGWAGRGGLGFWKAASFFSTLPLFVLFFRLHVVLPAFGEVFNLKREFLSLPVRLPMQMRNLNFMLSVIETVLTGVHGFYKGSKVLR